MIQIDSNEHFLIFLYLPHLFLEMHLWQEYLANFSLDLEMPRSFIGRVLLKASQELSPFVGYTRPEMEGLKVNYTVTGTRVSVKFGPLFPEVKYHLVCLSPCSSDFSQCFDQKNISEVC